jgi:hypothetical protein
MKFEFEGPTHLVVVCVLTILGIACPIVVLTMAAFGFHAMKGYVNSLGITGDWAGLPLTAAVVYGAGMMFNGLFQTLKSLTRQA